MTILSSSFLAMASWLPDAFSSHKVQLAVTAVASGVVVGGAIIGLQNAKRLYRVQDLKDSIPSLHDEKHVGKVR